VERSPSISPWHMWGTHANVVIPSTAIGVQTITQQLGRIEYKRPETWSFFLGGQIISGSTTAAVVVVSARLNLLFGVGRSVMDTTTQGTAGIVQEAFGFFRWRVPVSGLTMPASVDHANKYTTSVRTAPLVENDDATREKIDWIPAQDIQVQASVEMITADPAAFCTVRLTAFFAPRTHVRPDWWRHARMGEAEKFLGGETEGR